MKHIATLLGATLLLAGCSESGVNIRGNVAVGGSGKTLVVERVTPTGSRFVDSLRIGRQGDLHIRSVIQQIELCHKFAGITLHARQFLTIKSAVYDDLHALSPSVTD